jgi:hypothetical protein
VILGSPGYGIDAHTDQAASDDVSGKACGAGDGNFFGQLDLFRRLAGLGK